MNLPVDVFTPFSVSLAQFSLPPFGEGASILLPKVGKLDFLLIDVNTTKNLMLELTSKYFLDADVENRLEFAIGADFLRTHFRCLLDSPALNSSYPHPVSKLFAQYFTQKHVDINRIRRKILEGQRALENSDESYTIAFNYPLIKFLKVYLRAFYEEDSLLLTGFMDSQEKTSLLATSTNSTHRLPDILEAQPIAVARIMNYVIQGGDWIKKILDEVSWYQMLPEEKTRFLQNLEVISHNCEGSNILFAGEIAKCPPHTQIKFNGNGLHKVVLSYLLEKKLVSGQKRIPVSAIIYYTEKSTKYGSVLGINIFRKMLEYYEKASFSYQIYMISNPLNNVSLDLVVFVRKR